MNYITGFCLLLVLVLSIYFTYLVRKHSLKNSIVDIPNQRSSHTNITPRGGGLAFVIIFLLGLLVVYYLGMIETRVLLAIAGGGSLVSILGWMDDKTALSPGLRGFFYLLAAVWAVFCLGGFPAISFGITVLQMSWIGSIVAVIGTVWMINLYNFMDGVDGIAGTEAVTTALIGGFWLMNTSPGISMVCFLLAASVMGFLIWNWPPAKIFMGDVGSTFLGFVFAVLAMWSEASGALPLIIWIMLLGVFVIDATVTLIMRLCRGEKLYEAHQTHVYQLAVQAGYSHKQVTCAVLLINVVLGLIAVLTLNLRAYLLAIGISTAAGLIVLHYVLGKVLNNKIALLKATAARTKEEMLVNQSFEEAAASKS